MAGFTDFVATDASDTANAVPDILDRNWQTTAAVGLTVATGGVTGALMLTAFPAQTLATSGAIAGLAYVGKRRSDGLEAIPFLAKKDEQDKAEATEPAAA